MAMIVNTSAALDVNLEERIDTLEDRVEDNIERITIIENSGSGGGGGGSTIDETPSYKTVNLNEIISNIYEGGFIGLKIEGYKYGQFYGINSKWGSENVYVSPEGVSYSSKNPKILYTTKGTLELRSSSGTAKKSFDIDLCGNDNIHDEINGISLIRRWSDNFPLSTTMENETGDLALNGYDYFIYKIPEQKFAQPPKRVASNEIANLVTAGFTTVAKDNITNTNVKSAISLHYDASTATHILTFKIKTGYFSTANQFAYEFGKGVYKTDIRYELAEYKYTSIYIEPFSVEIGDYFVFIPEYAITGGDQNGNETSFTSIPYSFACNIYGNSAAKIKGDNEQKLLSAIVNELLDGGSDGTTTLLKLVEGTDVTTSIQNAVSALSTTGGTVYINNGQYAISNTITVPKGVVIAGIGEVILNASMTSSAAFFLQCGATLKGLTIKTPINYNSSAILIGKDNTNYTHYATKVIDTIIIGKTPVDDAGNSTSFSGNGIEVYCNNTETNGVSMVYNVEINGVKIYNYENGIYINSTEPSFIATTILTNIYVDNCNIGIYDNGYTTSCIGYTVQTRVNTTYGVKTKSGNFIGGHVYDLDLYNDNDPNRANIGHPKFGYFLDGGQYGYISDPIFTEYQSKYGYDWDKMRVESKIAKLANTWKTFRHVNEKIYALDKQGEQITASNELDFNGIIDNSIAFADTKYTITTNITDDDIIDGSISNIFNPFGDKENASDCLQLKNRTADDPYWIIVDFGEKITVSAMGMDFMCIPRYTKMEAHLPEYNSEDGRENTGNNYTPDPITGDYYIEVQELTNNRISVVQSTWAGSGRSAATKLKFSFANVAPTTGENIKIANLYAYNLYKTSDVYLPSIGGHIYNNGKITYDANHEVVDDNELVPKKYVDINRMPDASKEWYNTGRLWLNGKPIRRREIAYKLPYNSPLINWTNKTIDITNTELNTLLNGINIINYNLCLFEGVEETEQITTKLNLGCEVSGSTIFFDQANLLTQEDNRQYIVLLGYIESATNVVESAIFDILQTIEEGQ